MKTNEEILDKVGKLVLEINALPEKERVSTIRGIEREMMAIHFRGEDTVHGFVYLTKDTSQFKDMPENRVVNENSIHIRKLAESIQKHGILSPVVINEKWQKADGQRRIIAVRKYGLAVAIPYTIKEMDADTVGEMNQTQQKWNYKDWLHRYVTDNREDYIQYKDIASRYEQYMRSRSLRGLLMTGRVDPLKAEVWEHGEFKIKQDQLPVVISFLDLLGKVYLIGEKDNMFASDRNFQKALFDIYKKTRKLDVDRLLGKIRAGFNRINIKTDYKTYRKVLTSLYNSKLAWDRPHMLTEEEREEGGEGENKNIIPNGNMKVAGRKKEAVPVSA